MDNNEATRIAAAVAVVATPSAAAWVAPVISGQFAEFLMSFALVLGVYTIVQCIKYNAPVVWTTLVAVTVLYLAADVYVSSYYTQKSAISMRDLALYLIFISKWGYVLGRVRIFNVLAALYRVWGKMSIDERKEWLKHHGTEL